jgi:hypothetical protein
MQDKEARHRHTPLVHPLLLEAVEVGASADASNRELFSLHAQNVEMLQCILT